MRKMPNHNNSEVLNLAKTIWDYLLLHEKLEKSDAIMILGTHDYSIAHYGADLFLEKWAPYLIITGGVQHPPEVFNTAKSMTEAEYFMEIAFSKGVPGERIILENEAKNTGENFEKTEKLLAELNFHFDKFILVQKPYMERRTYATAKKQWPRKEFIVTSRPITFEDYLNSGIPQKRFINTMVGDLQRIKLYPAKGFQIPQQIPEKVWQAFEELVEMGYNERLIKD